LVGWESAKGSSGKVAADKATASFFWTSRPEESDVGAKQEIYLHINALAKTGLAIVLVSSELPEVLGCLIAFWCYMKQADRRIQPRGRTAEKVMACANRTEAGSGITRPV